MLVGTWLCCVLDCSIILPVDMSMKIIKSYKKKDNIYLDGTLYTHYTTKLVIRSNSDVQTSLH